MNYKYDSEAATLRHIRRVNHLLINFAMELLRRAQVHDDSKLRPPEKNLFDEWTPKLAATTYGSEEYYETLKGLASALNNHYLLNRHHPEHFSNGVDGMNLFDVIEMFADWKAAGERHNDGNIMKSIEHNKQRFAISDQLEQILINTADLVITKG